MAIDIEWGVIVGEKTLEDGGYVGDLMTVAREHINSAKSKGELTAQEAGEVYAAMIPAAFNAGLKFGMEKSLVEAQILDLATKKDLDLLKTQMATWVELYGRSMKTNDVDVVSTANIEAVFDRVNV